MPFENPIAQRYTVASVCKTVPAASGVYGITDERGWICVGDSDDVRTSLLAYLDTPKNTGARVAKGFCFELWPASDRQLRRERLILELRPRNPQIVSQASR